MATIQKRDANGKVIVEMTAPVPIDVSEVPEEIEGMRVVPFELPERTLMRFTESQIAEIEALGLRDQYHDQIVLARKYNAVVDDRPSAKTMREAERLSAQHYARLANLRMARNEEKEATKTLGDAKAELERAKKGIDPYALMAAEQKVVDADKAWQEANKFHRSSIAELEQETMSEGRADDGAAGEAGSE